MRRSVVKALGTHLPARVMTNQELAQHVHTDDAWIRERTGIYQRYIAEKHELTSTLGAKAAQVALQRAGIDANSVDLIILATTTPDDTMPSTATKIQHMIDMRTGAAFDINAACSGFVYALATADSFIRSGIANRVLVIGAETYSRILNWEDRTTCVLFGDGAGAWILEAKEVMDSASEEEGILYVRIHSDGQYHAILNTTGGVSSTGNAGVLTMAGKEVFRHAVARMSEAVMEGLEVLKLPTSALDLVVPHQANIRIMEAVAKKLDLPEKKLVTTVHKHANTSAASIPLALEEAIKDKRLERGMLVAIPALGAGLTWGACILRW